MVLLLEKLSNSLKPSSKLENHHHHDGSEALPASLHAFRSDVSDLLNRLLLDSKHGSEFFSMSWIKQCLDLLPNLNRAFAKLVIEIDYPMSKWEVPSIEDYLRYSLKFLELVNSISSSVSHLGQARLSISHGLSVIRSSPPMAMDHLKPIQFKNPNKELKVEERKERLCSGKEWVIHQALMDMESIGYWVFGIALSGLSGDMKPCMELGKSVSGCAYSSVMALDSRFSEAVREKNGVLKEVKDINDAAACLAAAGKSGGAAEKLERELEVMQGLLDGVGKVADGLFSGILAARNELLDSLRQRKH